MPTILPETLRYRECFISIWHRLAEVYVRCILGCSWSQVFRGEVAVCEHPGTIRSEAGEEAVTGRAALRRLHVGAGKCSTFCSDRLQVRGRAVCV